MKKKKKNWFFRVLSILFIIYLALFISLHTGYYEKTVRDRTLITEEKIKQFEEDVANNMVVDIKDYLPEEKDYSNFFTNSANSLSSALSNILDNNAENIWDFIKSLFIS